jgi:hypothetical protein
MAAGPARRRMKVYGARLGFFETVVAAPNQAEALKAWGVRQNLFASGEARRVVAEAPVRAALAHPGAPLRRAIGSDDDFSLDPALPKAPSGARSGTPARKSPSTKPPPARPAPPDRSALDRAEAELARIEAARARETAGFDARRRTLEADEAEAERRWLKARDAARADIDRAKRAFLRGGGERA